MPADATATTEIPSSNSPITTADTSQSRCCVVCARSSPKTIFSCRYKVHQRNIEILRVFFKRELDFGELCDRCYRLWYKHKRAKKETSPTGQGQIHNSTRGRKRKSSQKDVNNSQSPNVVEITRPMTNPYYNSMVNSSTISPSIQYPSFKKYRRPDEEDEQEVTYDKIFAPPTQFYEDVGHNDYPIQEEILKDSDLQIQVVEQPAEKIIDPAVLERKKQRQQRQEEEDQQILEQLENPQDEIHNEIGLLDALRIITKAPRRSKRKPVPIKSPMKVDPVYEYISNTQYQKLFTLDNTCTLPTFGYINSVPHVNSYSTTISTSMKQEDIAISDTRTNNEPSPPIPLTTETGGTST